MKKQHTVMNGNISNLFLPYSLALLAKEKGFNEECLAIFSQNNSFYPDGTFHLNHPHPFTITQIEPIIQDNREIIFYISAPLYQHPAGHQSMRRQGIDWY